MFTKLTIVNRLLRALVLCVPAFFATSCSETGKATTAASDVEDSSTTQPRQATYNCGESGSLTVENFRTSVRLTEPDGTSVDLPASPPTQQSRYGEAPYALVLEGNEALLMKNGKEPLTCSR
jgi:membrane-bound inhibitor of C-type lysozyme